MADQLNPLPEIARYPAIPVRDVIIFPHTMVAFRIGRPNSVRALEAAMASNQRIFLVTQHDPAVENPTSEQIYGIGTVARILKIERQQENVRIVIEGLNRATIVRLENDKGAFIATVRLAYVVTEAGVMMDALVQRISQLLEQHLSLMPEDQRIRVKQALSLTNPVYVADAIAALLSPPLSRQQQQELLEIFSTYKQLQRIIEMLEEGSERQLKDTIIKDLHKQIEDAAMPAPAKDKALQELRRLDVLSPTSAETIVSRNYIDLLLGIDWELKNSLKHDAKTDQVEPVDRPVHKPRVFIGHGQSPLWARLQLFLENDLGLETVNYESEPRVGHSIVPVLERMLDQATFAVLILTAEDETASGGKRARQNVIHEAGLFQGKLGFRKAILLIQEGLEEFTNVAGLQYIAFGGNKIESTFWELQRVLKREGLIQ